MGQQLWSWEAAQFEKIESSGVKAQHAASAWHVAIEAEDRAWGYRIALPDDAKPFLMWRTTLEVEWVNGSIQPGIAYFSGSDGISFQIDLAKQRAELRHVLHTMQTKRVSSFRIQPTETPFSFQLEFNALTKAMVGTLNGSRIFSSKLPFRGLPDLDDLTDVEILTTTPKGSLTGGTVSYGMLSIQCE